MKTRIIAMGMALSMHSGAPASISILNCFAGTSTMDSVTVGGAVTGLSSNSAVIGPGWDTTLSLGVGVLSTLTAEIDGSGTFGVQVSGLAGVGGSVDATRQFSGQTFDDFTSYVVTVDLSNSSDLSILDNVILEVGYDAGSGKQTLCHTGTGFGLAGVIDVLDLFNTSGTASIEFATGDVPDGAEMYVRINQDVTTSALGAETLYEGFSVRAIPEPKAAALVLGAMACLMLSRRRDTRSGATL